MPTTTTLVIIDALPCAAVAPAGYALIIIVGVKDA
jgi:hypothetical protein